MCFGFRISCTIYVKTLNIPLHNLKFPKNAKNMDNTAAKWVPIYGPVGTPGSLFQCLEVPVHPIVSIFSSVYSLSAAAG